MNKTLTPGKDYYSIPSTFSATTAVVANLTCLLLCVVSFITSLPQFPSPSSRSMTINIESNRES